MCLHFSLRTFSTFSDARRFALSWPFRCNQYWEIPGNFFNLSSWKQHLTKWNWKKNFSSFGEMIDKENAWIEWKSFLFCCSDIKRQNMTRLLGFSDCQRRANGNDIELHINTPTLARDIQARCFLYCLLRVNCVPVMCRYNSLYSHHAVPDNKINVKYFSEEFFFLIYYYPRLFFHCTFRLFDYKLKHVTSSLC